MIQKKIGGTRILARSCTHRQYVNVDGTHPVGPMMMVRRFLETASMICLLVLSNMVGRVMLLSVSVPPVEVGGIGGNTMPTLCLTV